MAQSKVEELVMGLAQPLVAETNLELVDVEFVKEGREWYLRVFIDKPEGVDLEDCSLISQNLGAILDEKDPIPQGYYLEVSSPGIERPLKKPADFTRFAGEQVALHLYGPYEGKKDWIGTLKGLEDNHVVLAIEDEENAIPYDSIASAKLYVEF